MEKSRNVSLIFECNDFDINAKDYWDEIISLTFIKNELEYLVITRLPYEDDIYIEHNDQINYLYAYYKDVDFKITKEGLFIEVGKSAKNRNLSNNILIHLNTTIENLKEILESLQLPTFPD